MGTASTVTIEQNIVSSIEEVIFKLFSFFFFHNIMLQWGHWKMQLQRLQLFLFVCITPCVFSLPIMSFSTINGLIINCVAAQWFCYWTLNEITFSLCSLGWLLFTWKSPIILHYLICICMSFTSGCTVSSATKSGTNWKWFTLCPHLILAYSTFEMVFPGFLIPKFSRGVHALKFPLWGEGSYGPWSVTATSC